MGCPHLTYYQEINDLHVVKSRFSQKCAPSFSLKTLENCANEYRYGFQGQEKDDEIKGEGNSLNYKYRMHDPRLGRFFAVDPLTKKYPYLTPYQFSNNRVIDLIELDGKEASEPPKNERIRLTVGYKHFIGAGLHLAGTILGTLSMDATISGPRTESSSNFFFDVTDYLTTGQIIFAKIGMENQKNHYDFKFESRLGPYGKGIQLEDNNTKNGDLQHTSSVFFNDVTEHQDGTVDERMFIGITGEAQIIFGLGFEAGAEIKEVEKSEQGTPLYEVVLGLLPYDLNSNATDVAKSADRVKINSVRNVNSMDNSTEETANKSGNALKRNQTPKKSR